MPRPFLNPEAKQGLVLAAGLLGTAMGAMAFAVLTSESWRGPSGRLFVVGVIVPAALGAWSVRATLRSLRSARRRGSSVVWAPLALVFGGMVVMALALEVLGYAMSRY